MIPTVSASGGNLADILWKKECIAMIAIIAQ